MAGCDRKYRGSKWKPLALWQDKSGNGYHFSQTTPTTAPTVQSNQINSKTVRFNQDNENDGDDMRVDSPLPIFHRGKLVCGGENWTKLPTSNAISSERIRSTTTASLLELGRKVAPPPSLTIEPRYPPTMFPFRPPVCISLLTRVTLRSFVYL